MRYFIRFSFNGEAIHGWLMQENVETIQSKVMEARHFKPGLMKYERVVAESILAFIPGDFIPILILIEP